MSRIATVQYGDNGVEMRINLRTNDNEEVDLSDVDTSDGGGGEVWILVQQPSGDSIRKQAYITGTSTIYGVFFPDDLDQLGVHKIQGYIKTNTSRYHTEVGYFEVLPNIDSAF